jgi:vacuolar-type H+-ATPase subunit H
MKQQNERAALVSEIEDLEERLTGLRAEKDRLLARRANSSDYIPIPELSPVLEGITRTEGRLHSLRDKLAHIDRVSAYRLAVETASARSDEARQAAEDAGARAAELGARITRLRQRVETLQAETTAAESWAREAETAAQSAYAKAIAGGDTEAEKTALQALGKVKKETLAIKTKAAGDAGTLAALASEVEDLERQAAAAREETDIHRKVMYGAELVRAQAAWDEAAETLLAAGRKIAQVADTGGLPSGLSSLHVPLFRPDRNFIAERDTREVA